MTEKKQFFMGGSISFATRDQIQSLLKRQFTKYSWDGKLHNDRFIVDLPDVRVAIEEMQGFDWGCSFEVKGTDLEWMNFLTKIRASLLDLDLLFSFGHHETDSDDQELSEELAFNHPKYDISPNDKQANLNIRVEYGAKLVNRFFAIEAAKQLGLYCQIDSKLTEIYENKWAFHFSNPNLDQTICYVYDVNASTFRRS